MHLAGRADLWSGRVTDIGLRNFTVGMFGRYQSTQQLTFVFQNLVLRLLIDNPNTARYDIRYWRTKNRAEVDFVLKGADIVIPVECKCQRLAEPKITRSMKSFIDVYRPTEAWIVNLTLRQDIMVNETTVKFMPFWELLVG
ncbi:MAG: DUF4143 domain-containing protein [Nitrospirae bacterium]|nr:MAG: DUF4143 domain-containing protein [Nitrospirota bacterium]